MSTIKVQPRKTRSNITEKVLTGWRRIKTNKRDRPIHLNFVHRVFCACSPEHSQCICGDRCRKFGLIFHCCPYFVRASSKDAGDFARLSQLMRLLILTVISETFARILLSRMALKLKDIFAKLKIGIKA